MPRAISQAATEFSKVTPGDMSVNGPALWASKARSPNPGLASVLAWNGTDANHFLNVIQSSDSVDYGGKVTLPETSATRLAVAGEGLPTTIVVAWTGTGAQHHINLLCQGTTCTPSTDILLSRPYRVPRPTCPSPGA
jgi:hypothetical protein